MKKIKVIKKKNLGFRWPLWETIILGLLLDRLQVAEWIWGVAITLTVFYWGLWIFSFWIIEQIDLFEND